MLTLATLLLASCSKDEINGGGSGSPTREESVVSLTIYDGTLGSRAAGSATDNPTAEESTVDESLGIK